MVNEERFHGSNYLILLNFIGIIEQVVQQVSRPFGSVMDGK